MLEAIIACCLVVGGSFTLIGSIGLARLPDLFTRLHGPTKATTLGLHTMYPHALQCYLLQDKLYLLYRTFGQPFL